MNWVQVPNNLPNIPMSINFIIFIHGLNLPDFGDTIKMLYLWTLSTTKLKDFLKLNFLQILF